jgi:Glycosyl transferase family 2
MGTDQPKLSIVLASVNGLAYLVDCVTALERQTPEIEVIVAGSAVPGLGELVAEQFPRVRLLLFDTPMTVPELRAAGMFAARAPFVAVIEDHCNVRDEWAERLLAAHAPGHPVVGGAVCNSARPSVVNWAAFLSEYSGCTPPLPAGAVRSVPGMNVSYSRAAIAAMDDLLREGSWENRLHARLLERDVQLWSEPEAVLDHAKNFSVLELFSQGFHFSRTLAADRSDGLGGRRWLHVLASPLLVPLLYRRIWNNVRRTGHRREFTRSSPLILLYLVVWAGGEAVGGSVGAGNSPLRVR